MTWNILEAALAAYLLVGGYLTVRETRLAIAALKHLEFKSNDAATERGMRAGAAIVLIILGLQQLLFWPLVHLRRFLKRKSGQSQVFNLTASLSRPTAPHTFQQERLRMWELVADEPHVFDAPGAVLVLLLVAWKVHSRQARSIGHSDESAGASFFEMVSQVSQVDLNSTSLDEIAEGAIARIRPEVKEAESQVH